VFESYQEKKDIAARQQWLAGGYVLAVLVL
jgi:hypothetical protein